MLSTGLAVALLLVPQSPQGKADPLAEPVLPRDARVQPEKITQSGVPPIVVGSAAPVPVYLEIAPDAESAALPEADYRAAREAIDRGLAYLVKSQGRRGGWSEREGAAGTDQPKPSTAAPLAVTALAAKAIAQAGHESDPALARAREYLRLGLMRSGAFEPDPTGALGNYVACAVVLALAGSTDPDDLQLLDQGLTWIRRNQWDQTEGLAAREDWFGGTGYGNRGRPDLSNTQMFMDALHDAGVSADDPAVQRALVFVSRAQNLKSADAPAWAQAGSGDGGFVYTPANGGESFASEEAGEGRYGEALPPGTRSLRSYGSMTYAGYKGLLYAGLTRDDPRVKAAREWLAAHFTFAENPGLGTQGLFYYLHALSRALAASREATLVDASGTTHRWREELIATLVSMQRSDGSWINQTPRWQEDLPELVTAYALLALEEAIKPWPEGATTSR